MLVFEEKKSSSNKDTSSHSPNSLIKTPRKKYCYNKVREPLLLNNAFLIFLFLFFVVAILLYERVSVTAFIQDLFHVFIFPSTQEIHPQFDVKRYLMLNLVLLWQWCHEYQIILINSPIEIGHKLIQINHSLKKE